MGNGFMNGIRSKSGATAEFALVTPEQARGWLAAAEGKNIRRMAENRIAAGVKTLNQYGWIADGSPIRFFNNIVIDGQHRLQWIVSTGITVEALLVRLSDERALLTIDTGQVRSAGQLATGVLMLKNSDQVVAGARAIMTYESGGIGNQSPVFFTSLQVVEFIRANPVVETYALVGRRGELRKLLPARETAWIYWAAHQAGIGQDAVEFFNLLGSGAGLDADDPILVLRGRLQEVSGRQVVKVDEQTRRAWIVIAWNKWRAGEPLKTLRWSRIGPAKKVMAFPQIDLSIRT